MEASGKRDLRAWAAAALAAFFLAVCFALGSAGAAQAASPDSANLLQGEYTAQASMKNAANPRIDSVANGALSSPIKITVDAKHDYIATLDMKPITMMGATAYMKSLWYWDGQAYQAVTPSSVYKDAAGKEVSDEYGSGYPEELAFPLLNKNAGDKDGYVMLQVEVPIIGAMSHGMASSTQQVLLQIDWTTLAQTKALETVSGGVDYTVVGKTATATAISKSAKSATVKSTVKIGGKSYRVTAIAAKAAYKAKSLKTVKLGKNLKSIGKNAFKGIAKKATFKCPKSKLKAYKKLVKAAGAPGTAKFRAA